ncbi:YkuJ family protein [Paucilactobacillus wasatchensis]|uniref:DUF1797 family protein n=1 Tax=Paucilactobacillus wasatchensis TaxID=1335616 RepID=A0A0D0YTX4_9LACO|nr:YkuJ family protein [Paucilactobacillus wasatchensis]KIS02719.1 hypothetical protein WDC_1700 [Paucilactobacillus wasatchensis]
MEESKLFQILSRLYAMQRDNTSQKQVRRFEQFGIELCRVTYDHTTQLFQLTEYRPFHEFEFDDLDLTAIEIHECLSDMQMTF